MAANTEFPYNGTSGWSGSETSRERAVQEDANGVTSERHDTVLFHIGCWGKTGLTWKDIARLMKLHHGQASGALSNLHLMGRLARLTETRDRCAVYVLPQYVFGRPTSEHRSISSRNKVEDLRQTILDDMERWFEINGVVGEEELYDKFRTIVSKAGTRKTQEKNNG